MYLTRLTHSQTWFLNAFVLTYNFFAYGQTNQQTDRPKDIQLLFELKTLKGPYVGSIKVEWDDPLLIIIIITMPKKDINLKL